MRGTVAKGSRGLVLTPDVVAGPQEAFWWAGSSATDMRAAISACTQRSRSRGRRQRSEAAGPSLITWSTPYRLRPPWWCCTRHVMTPTAWSSCSWCARRTSSPWATATGQPSSGRSGTPRRRLGPLFGADAVVWSADIDQVDQETAVDVMAWMGATSVRATLDDKAW